MNDRARLPKYLAVHDDIRARIQAGEWAPEEALPAQRELAASYGVTIMTLRRAVQLLENEGLIETRHGAGMFPASRRYHYDLMHLSGFAEDLIAQGARVDTEVLGSERVVAPTDVARALHLRSGEQVLGVRRLRRIDARPSVLQLSYLRWDVGVSAQDLHGASLYEVLARRGLAVGSAEESITVSVLEQEQAAVLERPISSPVMVSRRCSITEDGHRVLYDRALIPADIAELRLDRGPDRLVVAYHLDDTGRVGL
ncbi:GntR family transcriptional regulator [Nocardia bovistercoris]|uniref:GntR family transcriptional regulator n=1 Tax=Nocardia bovistercoris TaxID=2785916 RepID=A0A931I951_9NOCA|nr:GntR family transcriptional regulator [Nocardia bovistercoris]MBH0776371.1 GntR family transcriptional regulator [Nocardia bovistercoris]